MRRKETGKIEKPTQSQTKENTNNTSAKASVGHKFVGFMGQTEHFTM